MKWKLLGEVKYLEMQIFYNHLIIFQTPISQEFIECIIVFT